MAGGIAGALLQWAGGMGSLRHRRADFRVTLVWKVGLWLMAWGRQTWGLHAHVAVGALGSFLTVPFSVEKEVGSSAERQHGGD